LDEKKKKKKKHKNNKMSSDIRSVPDLKITCTQCKSIVSDIYLICFFGSVLWYVVVDGVIDIEVERLESVK